jgi:hypothetical protein
MLFVDCAGFKEDDGDVIPLLAVKQKVEIMPITTMVLILYFIVQLQFIFIWSLFGWEMDYPACCTFLA